MNIDERVLFGLVLVTGVIVPGFVDYLLSTAGYESIGMVAWAVGYLMMAVAVWYRWIRPLDLTGPVEE
jgi:hypothetical protein